MGVALQRLRSAFRAADHFSDATTSHTNLAAFPSNLNRQRLTNPGDQSETSGRPIL